MKRDRMFHVIVLSGIGLAACGGVEQGNIADAAAEASSDGFPAEGLPVRDGSLDRFPSELGQRADSGTDSFPTEGPVLLDGSIDRFPSETFPADASIDSFPTEGAIILDSGGKLDGFPKEAPAP